MSETTADPVTESPELVEAVEVPVIETQPEPTTETPSDAPPKPTQRDRRIAQLSARLGESSAAREAAERRAEAAEALLRANQPDEPQPAPSARTVEQEAARLLAERDFNQRRQAVIIKGEQEFGKEGWLEKTSILGELGVTANQAFLDALIELPNAPKIVARLADDVDLAMELMGKSPTAMAAKLGRMDAEMERTATPAKPTSNAPRPANPIQTGNVAPEPDIYDESLSMAEWNALMDKRDAAKRAARRAMGR